jgi:hypothetical protein
MMSMMKNISPYNLFENDNEMGANVPKEDRKLLGFAIHAIMTYEGGREVSNYMIMGSAYTFGEFIYKVMEDYNGVEPEDMEGLKINDIEAYENQVYDIQAPDYIGLVFWHGLEPKSNQEEYDTIELSNPVMTTDLLNKYFSNVSIVMSTHKYGNENDNSYIVNSIKNSPELLFDYENDAKMFDELTKKLGYNEKQLDALRRYNAIKYQL